MLEIVTNFEVWERVQAIRRAVNPDTIDPKDLLDLSDHSEDSYELGRRIEGGSAETAEIVALLAMRSMQADALKSEVEGHAMNARHQGVSWSRIARATGVSRKTAKRRWTQRDPIPFDQGEVDS
jgi:hypothetical protein